MTQEKENSFNKKLSKLIVLLIHMPIEVLCYRIILESNTKTTLPYHKINLDKLFDFILALTLSLETEASDKQPPENWWQKVLCLAEDYIQHYINDIGNNPPQANSLHNINYGSTINEAQIVAARIHSVFTCGNYESAEQIKDEIKNLYCDFQKDIKRITGLDLEQIIAICDRSIEIMFKKHNDIDSKLTIPKNTLLRKKKNLQRECQDSKCILRSELLAYNTQEEFNSFAIHFVQRKISNEMLQNINSFIANTLKPLIQVDDNSFCIPTANNLYRSLRFHLELLLTKDQKLKDRFQKNKGKYLEDATIKNFKAIFGDLGQIYTSVYETPDSQNEHDIVIVYQKTLLIIECKSTLITDYFSGLSRDGYLKLKQQFKRSIQSGYVQATRLKNFILSQEKINLYDKKGNILTMIKCADFDCIECICVTHENEGMFATSLNILLEKKDSESYPYCINLADLTQLSEFQVDKEIQLSPRKFVHFLAERKHLHGKLLSVDELDYWGCFLKEKSFKQYSNGSYIDPNYSKIFDMAYMRKQNS